MKLLIVVVNNRDREHFTDALVQHGYRFTEIGSTGGFLREGNTTLLIGIEDERMEGVFQLVREICKTRERVVNASPPAPEQLGAMIGNPMKVELGGAKVFVLNVEQFVEV